MKMRKCYIMAAIALMAASLASCDDFLEKEPNGYLTDENSYDTQYKMQAALNSAYDILQTDELNESDWRFGEATSDNVEGADEGLSSQMGQLVNFRFTTNNDYIKRRWVIYYKGVHRVNQVIANISKVKLSSDNYVDYRNLRYILGQAKFLRALYYFNLVKTFGGVPIRPEEETVEGLVVPRSTKEECYAYIERDLREAIVLLPAKFVDTEAGKAGGGAAVGLLMKVLMYEATPGVASEKWAQMVKLGQYMVDGATLTIGDILHWDTDYDEDWETFRERMLYKPKALNADTDPYEQVTDALPLLANAHSLSYKDYYGNSIPYIYQFYQDAEFAPCSVFEIVFKESADGTDGDTNEGGSIYDTMYSTSPVMWATAGIVDDIFGTDVRNTGMIGHQNYAPDGDLCQCGAGKQVSLKWYTPVKERPQYAGDNGKNRRYMRFVEVVLMYAEALNECGYGQEALTQLNKCKAQANTINSGSQLYPAGGYGLMRDNIWKERRIELCYEFDRFFDLVRQGRAAKVLRTFGAGRVNKRGYYFIEGVNEIFPIPQNEIDLSNGVVEQNPGY